jgi:squalene-hopene/tetraprenyl-beta-curcumene cyclase
VSENVALRAAPDNGLRDQLGRALHAAQHHLLSIQKEDGHWVGELEGDTILESEYILAMHFVGRSGSRKVGKAAGTIRRRQLPTGGWAIYPGGSPDISASVKAYFVLKLTGDDPEAEHMVRARRVIHDLGGVDACNSFTKIYLSIFGQYDWAQCPTVPPEILLLPRWFYINLYEMSSWSRAIIVPLSIVSALKPTCPVPEGAGIGELFVPGYSPPAASFWRTVFNGVDRGLKLFERLPYKPTRDLALKRAEEWILERLGFSDGLGAIFPPIVNTIFALQALGYSLDHPIIKRQIRELEKLEVEEEENLRVQPCFSPVWDTAYAINALVDSGLAPDHPALLRAAGWMLDRRGHGSGDWRMKNRQVRIPGWFFEYANPFYPDCDTTAQSIVALSKLRFPPGEEAAYRRAIDEAHRWHLSMQNRDGGWGAFDRDCDKVVLTHVPFADHNAMIDPSTTDLTARGLETLAALGHGRSRPEARRAVEFVLREQEEDGSWYGRWGCNYLYGTYLAAWSLAAVGLDPAEGWGRRAAAWLRSCQNDDGGWGELPLSYEDPTQKGIGPSTASQTAWAVMGLLALGEGDASAVRRGIDYLLREQRRDGSWRDEHWTGTGFPGVFYLRYHLYSVYFPLMALGYYAEHTRNPARLLSRTA